MDPNAAYDNLCDMVEEAIGRLDSLDELTEEQTKLLEMAEQASALFDWIENGGFLPAVWRRSRK